MGDEQQQKGATRPDKGERRAQTSTPSRYHLASRPTHGTTTASQRCQHTPTLYRAFPAPATVPHRDLFTGRLPLCRRVAGYHPFTRVMPPYLACGILLVCSGTPQLAERTVQTAPQQLDSRALLAEIVASVKCPAWQDGPPILLPRPRKGARASLPGRCHPAIRGHSATSEPQAPSSRQG